MSSSAASMVLLAKNVPSLWYRLGEVLIEEGLYVDGADLMQGYWPLGLETWALSVLVSVSTLEK